MNVHTKYYRIVAMHYSGGVNIYPGYKNANPNDTDVVSNGFQPLVEGTYTITDGEISNDLITWDTSISYLFGDTLYARRDASTEYDTTVTASISGPDSYSAIYSVITIAEVIEGDYWLDVNNNQILDVNGNPIGVI